MPMTLIMLQPRTVSHRSGSKSPGATERYPGGGATVTDVPDSVALEFIREGAAEDADGHVVRKNLMAPAEAHELGLLTTDEAIEAGLIEAPEGHKPSKPKKPADEPKKTKKPEPKPVEADDAPLSEEK